MQLKGLFRGTFQTEDSYANIRTEYLTEYDNYLQKMRNGIALKPTLKNNILLYRFQSSFAL